MWIILDCDDMFDIISVRDDEGNTMHFIDETEAEDYAERHLGEYKLLNLED